MQWPLVLSLPQSKLTHVFSESASDGTWKKHIKDYPVFLKMRIISLHFCVPCMAMQMHAHTLTKMQRGDLTTTQTYLTDLQYSAIASHVPIKEMCKYSHPDIHVAAIHFKSAFSENRAFPLWSRAAFYFSIKKQISTCCKDSLLLSPPIIPPPFSLSSSLHHLSLSLAFFPQYLHNFSAVFWCMRVNNKAHGRGVPGCHCSLRPRTAKLGSAGPSLAIPTQNKGSLTLSLPNALALSLACTRNSLLYSLSLSRTHFFCHSLFLSFVFYSFSL